jgi:hypothetical protein
MTFYAEDCGADVVALDIQDPQTNGFGVLHDIRKSSATHVTASIYDIHPDLFGTFDVVVFSGVHYHLKHPLLALERLSSVTAIGGSCWRSAPQPTIGCTRLEGPRRAEASFADTSHRLTFRLRYRPLVRFTSTFDIVWACLVSHRMNRSTSIAWRRQSKTSIRSSSDSHPCSV